MEKPGEIRPALERARRSLLEGVPVVLDCLVDGTDYPPGFVSWYKRF